MDRDFRPRLSVDMPEELHLKMRNLIPHGLRGKVFILMVSDLIDLIERFGAGVVLGSFIEREVTMKDICKLDLEVKDGDNRRSK
jgi:hypothetical protein